ncbi:hypothetical protein NP233_g5173 [Leucocoprinus birnbaumii]|uniref:Uncharacterized protein n=1 Tax=Leucocoprinus birnbaumii TaxID=56174 RepID=A0AAD5VZP1_9AGAR|nr:hypothetical protein NP233_g5173 [Leucocoprinus birnbaumii]
MGVIPWHTLELGRYCVMGVVAGNLLLSDEVSAKIMRIVIAVWASPPISTMDFSEDRHRFSRNTKTDLDKAQSRSFESRLMHCTLPVPLRVKSALVTDQKEMTHVIAQVS